MGDFMNVEQQKGDEHHGGGGAGGTRSTQPGRQQAFAAFDQTRALTVNLMEHVCDPKNLIRAYRQVLSNKGKPGVDGMTVHELGPRPVRGVQIPKPGGGQRQLGIPVVGSSGSTDDSARAESRRRSHLF
jgi:RNA-directed DNA polymerase